MYHSSWTVLITNKTLWGDYMTGLEVLSCCCFFCSK